MSTPNFDTNIINSSNSRKLEKFASYNTNQADEQAIHGPTGEYSTYQQAYDYFNDHLFHGRLPPCLITLQRKSHTRGYYASRRFASRQDNEVRTDEIALNPDTFAGRTDKEIFSTLVHEQVHLWQAHFGKAGRGRYHNQEWARRMLTIGLRPISLDNPAKMTGQKVTHEILPGGRFDKAADELLATGFHLNWQSPVQLILHMRGNPAQAVDRDKFTCPQCSTNAWAKPDSKLVCARCLEKHINRCGHWLYPDDILAITAKYVMRSV